MNIEVERKAFEAAILPTGLFKSVEWNGERYTMSGGRCMTQDYFEVWLKAKAHAAEMAKLTVPMGCVDNMHCFIGGQCFHCGLRPERSHK